MTHPQPSPALSAEVVAQMMADRKDGTRGPWTFELDEDTQEPRLYGDGSLIAVFGNHMTVSEAAWIPEADARRATRLPDLEAGYLDLTAENAALRASKSTALERVKRIEKASSEFLEAYVDMINSGDCGNWDPEKEPLVIALRATLTTDKAGQHDRD